MSLIDPLLVLQEFDTKIADLGRKIASLPKHRAIKEAELSDTLRRQLQAEQRHAPESAESAAPVDFDTAIADIRAEIAEVDERLASAKAELEEQKAKRAECAASIDPKHLRFYERLAISHHPTIVKLEGNICSGCHLAQPPSTAHLIKHDTDFVTCGMCGRILY